MIPVTFNTGAPGIGLNRRVTLFSPGSSLMKDAFNYAVSPFQPITFSPRPPVPGREADGVRLGCRLFTPLLLRCFDISFAKDRRWGTGGRGGGVLGLQMYLFNAVFQHRPIPVKWDCKRCPPWVVLFLQR